MLLIKVALLALSVLPTSFAERHHSSSTLTTLASVTNITAGAPAAVRTDCPTITATVAQTFGACPDAAKEKRYECAPIDPGFTVTSTFHVGCDCPAATTPTTTISRCPNVISCAKPTDWVYLTSVGCESAD